MARRLQKTASLACAISSLDSQDSFLMQVPVSRSLSKENAQPVKSPLAAAAVPTPRGLNNRDPISSQFRRTEGQDGAWFLVWPLFPAWIPPLFVCLCEVSHACGHRGRLSWASFLRIKTQEHSIRALLLRPHLITSLNALCPLTVTRSRRGEAPLSP